MAITATKKKTKKKVCSSCGRELPLNTGFYSSKSPMFAVDKKINICKECFISSALNNETGEIDEVKFKNLLRRTDFPFYRDNLQSATLQYAKEHSYVDDEEVKYHGDDIIKLYMKNVNSLRQLSEKNFEDSEKDGFIQKRSTVLKNANADIKMLNNTSLTSSQSVKQEEQEELIYDEKWMGKYTKKDIDYLNNYYTGLERDYKIITENHRDYARKIAKASLQMDKAFDEMINGLDGADARYKNAREAFDTLSKSAKFSESTRSVNDVGISSFSKVAAMVEAHNWIPEHKPLKKDTIDEMIDYLSTITKSL